ncbi:MAG: DUF3014 domain-containing protein [Gammaproteobacteria bacterium]|nr:DUF3014 domain-containing protein [Gammaproteobacteria bacterium]
MDKRNSSWLVALTALVILVAGSWYFWSSGIDTPDAQPPQETPPAAVPDTPRYPVPALQPRPADAPDLVPLPPLDDSDSYFALALTDLLGRDIDNALVASGLIEKFVTTVDNLPRSHVAERIRPLTGVPGSFVAEPLGNEYYTIDPANYARYEALIGMATNADIDDAVATYRRFYPLLQEAYVNLGYPDGHFNDRVVEVVDHLLDTPQPEQPVRLIRPHVLYQYADPGLEALSSGQKLMLRMGPDNAALVATLLEQLRTRLVSFE